MKCTGTGYDWDHCRVEKRGCKGCYHWEKEGEKNEQKTCKCTKNKSNKTN